MWIIPRALNWFFFFPFHSLSIVLRRKGSIQIHAVTSQVWAPNATQATMASVETNQSQCVHSPRQTQYGYTWMVKPLWNNSGVGGSFCSHTSWQIQTAGNNMFKTFPRLQLPSEHKTWHTKFQNYSLTHHGHNIYKRTSRSPATKTWETLFAL